MKAKEKKQLREKTKAELQTELVKAKETLSGLLLERVQGKLKNTSSLTNTRKTIAVIQTYMAQKEEV